jgi:hypothetical protein
MDRAGKQSAAAFGRSRRQSRSAHVSRGATVSVAASALFLIGLSARTVVRWDPQHGADRLPSPPGFGREPAAEPQSSRQYPESHPSGEYTGDELRVAVNQLFASVKRAVAEDSDLPEFARAKVAWLTAQQRAGGLSITLLKDATGTNLSDEDLMASGRIDGKSVIVIAQRRFLVFLIEGGRISAPFSRQQVNDFMLGLVHETVHLQNASPGNPASLADRLEEELRTWREVDVNVVRPLRQLDQPMNRRFLEADDALRSCGSQEPCRPLRDILFPTEQSR